MKKECAGCNHWKRDGIDGVCFGGTPQPKILPKGGKQYVVMWPRTQADEHCPGWEGDD